ncbi:MAG: hypothetical protein M5U28_55285 [Sandaracinaceae bacterium]|nr:hypothetical protein [Sandaracinaceae bacterium]
MRTMWLGCGFTVPRQFWANWLAWMVPPIMPFMMCGSGMKPARRFAEP